MENSNLVGLFPSNYVQLLHSTKEISQPNNTTILPTSNSSNNVFQSHTTTTTKENVTSQPQQEQAKLKVALDERVNSAQPHKLDQKRR